MSFQNFTDCVTFIHSLWAEAPLAPDDSTSQGLLRFRIQIRPVTSSRWGGSAGTTELVLKMLQEFISVCQSLCFCLLQEVKAEFFSDKVSAVGCLWERLQLLWWIHCVLIMFVEQRNIKHQDNDPRINVIVSIQKSPAVSAWKHSAPQWMNKVSVPLYFRVCPPW